MSEVHLAILWIEDEMQSAFKKYKLEVDPSEAGAFPRIFRRSIIGEIGLFIDICVERGDFNPAFPGDLPSDPRFEGWLGIYLRADANVGKRYRLFYSKKPEDLTPSLLDKVKVNMVRIINKQSASDLVEHAPRFDEGFVYLDL